MSAQEPRMACHLSKDENMLNAYLEGKDLYAVIAAAALGTTYEQCLEFLPEGCIATIDGNNVVSGSGKDFEVEVDEQNSITVKYYELLDTTSGEKAAKDILKTDEIIANTCNLKILNIVKNNDKITFYFSI